MAILRSVSEELMVSASPCEFSPLQLNYPFSPLQLSIFPLWLPCLLAVSLRRHYISSIFLSLSYSATFSFLSSVTILSCLLSVLLNRSLLSYFSRTRYPKDALHVSGKEASECNLLNWNVMVRQHTRLRNS